MKKRLLWVLAALIACAALMLGYRASASFAAWTANVLSRPLGGALSALSARLPFPAAEALALALVLFAALGFLRACVRCARQRCIAPLGGFTQNLLLALSLFALGYVLLWSPLQQVSPLDAQLSLRREAAYELSELQSLCRELTLDANRLQPLADMNADNLAQRTREALASIDTLQLSPAPIKLARYPELFKALGMAGVYVPWTGEAVISNQEMLISFPFISCHESAHQCGYAREDEANLVAYLACREGDEYYQYSGTMYALYYCMEALHDADTAAWTQARLQMSDAVQRDYYRLNGLRNADTPWMVLLRTEVSDAFLRITRQSNPKSYGDVVDLLLAHKQL